MPKPEDKPEKEPRLRITVDYDEAVTVMLGKMNIKLDKILANQGVGMATMEELQADVTAQTSAVDSITRLVTGLADQLDEAIANGADPAVLSALSEQIRSNTQALVDSVAANTEINPL
jgi:hypothetical protein